MKRIFFIVSIIFVVTSCDTTPNGEKIVLDYLQNNTTGTDYSIIEISTIDSLYSPFELINSLILQKSNSYANLSKQLMNAFDKPTIRERRASALDVANLALAEYNRREDFNDIVTAITYPKSVDKPANRTAYNVKYKVDGKILADIFYIEKDGNAISHTASELQDRFLHLCDINSKLFTLKMDAEDTARTMR